LARSPEAGPTARAAAIRALGELGAASSADAPVLLTLADANDTALREAALLTLARVGAKDESVRAGAAEAIAAGLFASDDDLRTTAAAAAAALATRTYKRSADPFGVPDGPIDLKNVLAGLAPDPFGAADRTNTLVSLGPALQKAAVAAVSTSPERARVV